MTQCKYEGCDGCNHECPVTGKCKAYFRAGKKAYEATHVEERREAAKAYRETHREHMKQLKKDWAEKNKDHIARYEEATKVRQYVTGTICNHKAKGYDVQFTVEELTAKLEATKVCRYCGRTMEVVRDHKASMDGPSLDRTNNEQVMTLENTQIICKRCNVTKGARTHSEFIAFMRHALELNE